MRQIVFSIFDMKTGAYSTPFFMAHVGEALRACIDLGQDRSTTVGRHPADFALYKIGEFDMATGLLIPEQPTSLGSIVSLLPAPRGELPLLDGAMPMVKKQPNGSVVEA